MVEPLLDKELKDCRLLDMGSGGGRLSLPFAKRVKRVKGVDVVERKIERARGKAAERGVDNIDFEASSVFDFEEKENYDIVVMNDFIEHVQEHKRALKICLKALKKEGVFYISTNNRLWPIEGHRYLPFLSYLPKPLAHRYVRLAGRGEAYDNCFLLTYIEVKDLLNSFPVSYEFEPPKDPDYDLYRVGKKFVEFSEAFWMFANAFQVVGKKLDSIE